MSKQYDRDKIFKMVSESYELGLTAAEYCRQKNFPSKIFYRYRQQYVEIYGAKPMPEPVAQSAGFVELSVAPPEAAGLSLEVGTHIRLRFDSLPDPTYLSSLLDQLSNVALK